MTMLDFLRKEGVSEKILTEVEKFRRDHKLDDKLASRIPNPINIMERKSGSRP